MTKRRNGVVLRLNLHFCCATIARPASRVAIRQVASYQADVAAVLYETLREFDPPVRDKVVFLKPNLIAIDPLGITNTSPAVIAAAREAFLRLGAARVLIGDGSGIERDSQAILESMHFREYAGPLRNIFIDLNVDDVERVPLKTRASRLKELFLPKVVRHADFLVSMPKLKTHHWAGVTLSLKNMFGAVPGACFRDVPPYGSTIFPYISPPGTGKACTTRCARPTGGLPTTPSSVPTTIFNTAASPV